MASGSEDVNYIHTIHLEEDLELHPDPSTERITGILWKIGPNKVTEWDEGFGPDVDYYGPYKERTELNKTTGRLVIKNMTKEDSGIYSVEVNGRLQSRTHKVEVTSRDTATGGIRTSHIIVGIFLALAVSLMLGMKFRDSQP